MPLPVCEQPAASAFICRDKQTEGMNKPGTCDGHLNQSNVPVIVVIM